MKKFILSIAATMALMASAATVPTFPGGEKALQTYLSSNMHYPEAAARNGIEGVVNVECTIKADGTVGPIKIVRMIDPDLEQEAIRLVKNMPAWTPADKNGAPVDATVTIPVTFVMPE
ncbi:MAG: energy transducer TonB [Muribaculaceae bacterium]|nr:energy transducer TonB [Muribaculaceae bacterium]